MKKNPLYLSNIIFSLAIIAELLGLFVSVERYGFGVFLQKHPRFLLHFVMTALFIIFYHNNNKFTWYYLFVIFTVYLPLNHFFTKNAEDYSPLVVGRLFFVYVFCLVYLYLTYKPYKKYLKDNLRLLDELGH